MVRVSVGTDSQFTPIPKEDWNSSSSGDHKSLVILGCSILRVDLDIGCVQCLLTMPSFQRALYTRSPTRFLYPLLVPPSHTRSSYPLLIPAPRTPFSYPLLVPPSRTRSSRYHVLAQYISGVAHSCAAQGVHFPACMQALFLSFFSSSLRLASHRIALYFCCHVDSFKDHHPKATMRGRSPDYSPRRSYESPPRRAYGGRRRSPTPPPWSGRGGYGRDSELPTSLLVRNIPRDCTPDDLRIPFENFGDVKDVYLPKDYYTGLPRGFGFVQFLDPREAAEAQYYMDHQIFAGREITVVFAEENRKKPQEMRSKERIRGRPGFGGRRGSRSPRRFSPPPRGGRGGRRSISPSRSGRGHRRRSYTPSPGRYGRAASRSPSPVKSYRRTRDLSPMSIRRSPTPPPRSRGSELRANGRDEFGSGSMSPGGSPSAPQRKRRSPSPRQYSPGLQDEEYEEP